MSSAAAALAALATSCSSPVSATRGCSPSSSERRWLSELSIVTNAGCCRVGVASNAGNLAVPVQLNGVLVLALNVVFHPSANPFVALYFLSFFRFVLNDSVIIFYVPFHLGRTFPLLEQNIM